MQSFIDQCFPNGGETSESEQSNFTNETGVAHPMVNFIHNNNQCNINNSRRLGHFGQANDGDGIQVPRR